MTTAERYQRMLELMASADQSYLILASIAILFTMLWYVVVERLISDEKRSLSRIVYFIYYITSMILVLIWSVMALS